MFDVVVKVGDRKLLYLGSGLGRFKVRVVAVSVVLSSSRMHVIWNSKPLPFLQASSHCKHIAEVEPLHFQETCDLLDLLKHQCLLCRMMFVADSRAFVWYLDFF